ncbi:MAG: hypothetical protein HN929_05840 [Chloroflexi bacterium]|nr:hypothetical protein [Chloroflexota bacterium]MBT7080972.1 hypothetical protein [Chloroflexota bacterium]MBT7290551.1 hypothetical protein [Chloroflexota bacterium]
MTRENKKECQPCEFNSDCHYRHYEHPKCYTLREEKEEIEYYGIHSSLDHAFPDLAETDEDVEARTRKQTAKSSSEVAIANAIHDHCYHERYEVWVSGHSLPEPDTLKALSHVDLRLVSQNLAKAIMSVLKL